MQKYRIGSEETDSLEWVVRVERAPFSPFALRAEAGLEARSEAGGSGDCAALVPYIEYA